MSFLNKSIFSIETTIYIQCQYKEMKQHNKIKVYFSLQERKFNEISKEITQEIKENNGNF